jgi:two-component system response regulator YesN
MFTVLLVDDEIWSLEGIRKLFDWEKMGFTVIAQATDSSEAYDIICHSKPDVVITDIRMPEISGLELLNMTRKKGLTSEFVIISGFAEFEYAQEALRYGAFDYQLKPIDHVEAKLLFENLKLHLEQKQISGHCAVLKELVSGLNDPFEIFYANHFIPQEDYWQVVTLSGKEIDRCELLSLFNDIKHLPLRLQQDKTVVIFNGDQSLEKEALSRMRNRFGNKDLYIGFSSISDDISQLARLIREADMAASQHFIDALPGISRFTTSYCMEFESMISKMEKLIMVRNYEEICSVIDSLPERFQKAQLGIYHVTCLWNQLAVMIRKRFEREAVNPTDFLDYEEIVDRFENMAGLCRHMRELVKNVCFPQDSGRIRHNNLNGNFIALLEYVKKSYDKELSLGDLADKFFLNMSYCSELFKKVTGYTFSDYVTKLRMEKAVELMQSGKYTASIVCDMTGYNDYYYFSKIFKRFHGVTPSKFAGQMIHEASSDII